MTRWRWKCPFCSGEGSADLTHSLAQHNGRRHIREHHNDRVTGPVMVRKGGR